MAKLGHYKLDNGESTPSGLFPVKPLFKQRKTGHWLVERSVLEHKYTRSQKRKSQGLFTAEEHLALSDNTELLGSSKVENRGTVLDGYFLMTLHCVDRPSELCFVDISGQKLYSVNLDNVEEFDNVAYINASDNRLNLDAFSGFPVLRELELSLNGLHNINVNDGDFPHLEVLDLSYNSLSSDDILAISILPCLKVLHLTGNKLLTLPDIMSVPHQESPRLKATQDRRFCALEVLMLDDNCLSSPGIFTSLANLKRLRHLNLQGNNISKVPYLQQIADLGVVDFFTKKDSKHPAQDRPPSLNSPETQEVKSESRQKTDYSNLKFIQQEHGDSCTDQLQIPFPELQHLNLADNKIADEEALLAVALFPLLSELVIHSNPLTTQRSGDPPILTSILQDHLGIQIERKKTKIPMKSHIMVSINPKRKITTKIPKVPKLPLYLEAPGNPSPHDIVSAVEKKAKDAFEKTAFPREGLPLQSSKHQEGSSQSEGTANPAGDHMLEASDQIPRALPNVEDRDGKAFFMTQVDDEPMQHMLLEINTPKDEHTLPEQFRGYEMLLDAKPDPDMIQPRGIQQTARALEQALRNLRVYRDTRVHDNHLPKTNREMKKVAKALEENPKQIKKDRVEDFLTMMKDRKTTQEVPLDEVLKGKNVNKKEYEEALSLLQDIKGKYRSVYMKAMEPASQEESAEVQSGENAIAKG
ncbi:X-ray radiation resistance-associated protein 1 isoform X1 [Brienomyrus brachyistius]|uniref:X-ray radiation resistance-associated protein 1 isoform X1 n=1 Tax=Brienomyrus brachyistius TaxID=42636 RepID=UPI0020B17B5B|nr:X-ray radiation resistance-associated protein 1 isoform X1 [Brienomyrus brachyistius]XP_048838934.1 X-ray radiation resistance-associated protein 1 isoform X1 [Brienomyrus brachyistius]XP_048838935.1 X-ray radiation resistance-associated protein 1 isoform X1 [Brienomyrus brachyistius]